MIGQAAEIADGIVLWARPSSYIRDVVVPEITEVRHGIGPDRFWCPGCRASRRNRRCRHGTEGHSCRVASLFRLPFHPAMFDAAGYRDDVTAFDAATASPSRAISERFVLDLCAVATLRRFRRF
jgi:hypothetical protein